MAINFDKAFGLHPLALRLHAQRADVLASNLANADTPGYKAKDIDFVAVLQHAIGAEQRLPLATTRSGHVDTPAPGHRLGEPLYREPDQAALDGNTVDGDAERMHFMDNALAYESSLRFLNGKISGLMTALKGQ